VRPSSVLGPVLGLVVSGALLTGCSAGVAASPVAATRAPLPFHGAQPDDPATPRASFVLTDTDGAAYDFAARTAGRPTLLYFGYTSCPDECPTAMARHRRGAAPRTGCAGRRRAGRLRDDRPRPRQRGGPAHLARRLRRAGRGLRGSAEELAAAQRAVGVDPAQKQGPVPDPAGQAGRARPRAPAPPRTATQARSDTVSVTPT
jgi:hypothetical protein